MKRTLTFLPLIAALTLTLGACGKEADPAAGPAERVGETIDRGTAAAVQKAEELRLKHGDKIDRAQEIAAESARKLTDTVGEQMEKAGKKAQEIAQENKQQEPAK